MKNQFWASPILVPVEKRRVHWRKVARTTPVSAISEDLMKAMTAEKAVRFKVRAVVTVRNENKEDMKETIVKHWDAFTDKIGRNVVLELVSTEIDPKTKSPKKSNEAVLKDWSKKPNVRAERVNYIAEFAVGLNFGIPGAITVTNKHQQEFFMESITIEGFACGPVHFPCNSWVQSKKDHPGKRIFFCNKVIQGERSHQPCRTKAARSLKSTDLIRVGRPDISGLYGHGKY